MASAALNLAADAAAGGDVRFIRKTTLSGPATSRLRRRTLHVYLGVLLLGIGANLLSLAPGWQAAGAGLIVPGGGFLTMGGWWLLAGLLSVVLFVISMPVWLLTGNLLAPLVVWAGSAIAAGLLAHSPPTTWGLPASLAIGLGMLARIVLKDRSAERVRLHSGEARNRILPAAIAALHRDRQPAPPMAERELSAEDLAGLRYLYDLTLQPLGQFEGFVRKDDFQPAALRYQLDHIQYALSVVQCQYTPNFHGYLSQAQRYMIESLQLPEVCGYWKLESVWGNLRWNPDPIDTKDNIMLTGWSGHCLATYTANTGDRRYGEKGSLVFAPFKRKGSRTYAHDIHAFIRSLLDNYPRAPLYLYPCEPQFVYSQCNLFGYGAITAYDRAFGTSHLDAIDPQFRRNFYNEFELPDGNIQPILSSLTGLSLVFKPSVGATVSSVTLANVFDPALAERMYALTREEELRFTNDGKLATALPLQDSVDPGNYTRNTVFCLAWFAAAAREMGDEATAARTLALIKSENREIDRNGARVFEGVSVSTMANYLLARILHHDFWRDTVVKGPDESAFTGPLLAECRYPDVLVARAWSPAGDDLDLVLHDGNGGGMQTLGFERLQPGQRYLLTGDQQAEATADIEGRLTLDIMIKGRTSLQLRPTASV